VVQATDANGKQGNHSYTLTISNSGVTTTSLPSGIKGVAYNSMLSATGGVAPYSWTIAPGQPGKIPSGLSMSSSGAISGTPGTLGYQEFAVRATDSKGQRFSQTLGINTVMPLTVSGSALPTGTIGRSYKSLLGASGGQAPYTWKVVAGTPPSIIGVDPTGAVSGTPTQTGSYGFTVQASDASGQQVKSSASIAITGLLAITTTSLASGKAGVPYSANVLASGGLAPYSWNLTGGMLPPGVILSTLGGISGTPTTAGSFTFTLQVSDSGGGSSSQTYAVSMAAATVPVSITTTSLPNGTVGTAYSSSVSATGGTSPYTWAVSEGALPLGLALSSSGGISGNPTATAVGSSTFTLKVTDSIGGTSSQTYTVVIASVPVITTTSLPNGKMGVLYNAVLTATGGTAPYTWSVAAGLLPTGVGLGTSTGTISGTPLTAGTYNVTVQAVDSAGQVVSKALSFVVAAVLSITTTSIPNATTGVAYNATLTVSGSTPPITWAVSSGQLPAGLSLSSSGNITGTPSSAGSLTFVAQATDSVAGTASQSYTMTVANAGMKAGGLTAYPSPVLGSDLLLNPGFESGTSSWGPNNGFTIDSAVGHSGSASISLVNATQVQYTAEIDQLVAVSAGTYRFGGWVKLNGVGTNTAGSGVRMCLYDPNWIVLGCSAVLSGTADWAYYEVDSIVIPQSMTARLALQAYAVPNGTAWFDDLILLQEGQPLSVFMKYPNYRGILFSDQSQISQFDISVNVPSGAGLLSDYVLTGQVTDEVTSSTVATVTHAAVGHEVVSLDLTGQDPTHTYLATFVISRSNPSATYTYPAYRVSMAPGSSKASWAVSVDSQNRFLLHGVPQFLLGVYDNSLGYANDSATWDTLLTTERRLFQLPINVYNNFGYGGAPNYAIMPLMDLLGQHGMYDLTTANCFSNYSVTGNTAFWFNYDTPQDILTRSAHPYYGGFYAADECVPTLASDVLVNNYQRMQAQNPGGIVLGTLLPDSSLSLWRDSVDVLASDPYPMYGAEPAGGYPFHLVSDGTILTKNAVMGSRPTVEVIQYFQFTSQGRWPTEAELRSMSYMAIADGANGLLYWSLGDGGGLYYVCDGSDANHSPAGGDSWCPTKVNLFQELVDVTTELSALQPALSAVDDTTKVTGVNQPSIHTRVKTVGGTTYIIASNVTNTTVNSTFTLASPPSSVSVYKESRSVAPSGAQFSDTFLPYSAHVYQIQ